MDAPEGRPSKSQQIDEMGSLAGQAGGSRQWEGGTRSGGIPDSPLTEVTSQWEGGVQSDGTPDLPPAETVVDPADLVAMIGQQPVTAAMLQSLQEQFGPIEIEIVQESSSEESCDEKESAESTADASRKEPDSESFMLWPQHPIHYSPHGGGRGRNVPLLVELEEAEEVERLCQEVSQSRDKHALAGHSGGTENGQHMEVSVEGCESDDESQPAHPAGDDEAGEGRVPEGSGATRVSVEAIEEQLETQVNGHSISKIKSDQGPLSGGQRAFGATLGQAWLSPVPFLPETQEAKTKVGTSSELLIPSTPRLVYHGEADTVSGPPSTDQTDPRDCDSQHRTLPDNASIPDRDTEEIEVDITDLSREEIEDLLIAAQNEGLPFHPSLLELAAQHGLEFEIVMEDEDGNVIEEAPPDEYVLGADFQDLMKELKAASGHDMEFSVQYDSAPSTGSATGDGADSVNLSALHQQIQEHLHEQPASSTDCRSSPTEGGFFIPQMPTVSLEDLHNVSEETEEVGAVYCQEDNLDLRLDLADVDACSSSEEDWSCPGPATSEGGDGKPCLPGSSSLPHLPQPAFPHSDSGQHTGNDNNNRISSNPVTGANKGEDSQLHSKELRTKAHQNDPKTGACSARSSELDTDNEPDEKIRFNCNRSDRSFSSNTSVDGVIDTRADLEDSEEEIVITMEVPGIPTEDGGFIIDMSNMFIPISIPGQGDQEITVEIDPSGFDLSKMVQNEDGTIEVDIQSEIHNWITKYSQYSAPADGHGSGQVIECREVVEGLQTAGPYAAADAGVNEAVRATVVEQLEKTDSEGCPSVSGCDVRPCSDSLGYLSPQHGGNNSSMLSVGSSSSTFDWSPTDDELLKLLERIEHCGKEMRKELETSYKRQLCLHEEKSAGDANMVENIDLLEKEIEMVRTENDKLQQEFSKVKSRSDKDQDVVRKLEEALDGLQDRVHVLQWENTDLKKINATLERRSCMVVNKATNTEKTRMEPKMLQVGSSMFSLRQRGTQSVCVNTADVGVQQCGQHFTKCVTTTTCDPVFRAFLTRTTGTQSAVTVLVDRGVLAMSSQETLSMTSSVDVSTRATTIGERKEKGAGDGICGEVMRIGPATGTTETPPSLPSPAPLKLGTPFQEPIKPDTRYPWHNFRQQESQRLTHQPQVSSRSPAVRAPSYPAPLKANQAIDKLFTRMTPSPSFQRESPTMENSATESVDTDEEHEGPEKWQRLSTVALTSDPIVVKLQRSLASAMLENDLLQSKMAKTKREMATRLEEWADLLEASKTELKQAKVEAKILSGGHSDQAGVSLLHQKVSDLEQTLISAQEQNQQLVARLESATVNSYTKVNIGQAKVNELEEQNILLKSKLANVKDERDQLAKVSQLLKNLGQLRQHYRHGREGVTDLESLLVGMAGQRSLLQNEIQMLRDEYQYMKKGLSLMERYLVFDKDTKGTSDITPANQPVDMSELTATEPQTRAKMSDAVEILRSMTDRGVSVSPDSTDPGAEVAPSIGDTEVSLHRHISALASRIQSELGIKVKLVGEVDPSQILGPSIHSQDSPTSAWTTYTHSPQKNAVDELFKSVCTDPSSSCPVMGTVDVRDVGEITLRAVPSPREMSRDSSPSSPRRGLAPHELMDRSDIESLDASELRRKRLGMFVDAYTSRDHVENLLIKARDPSPESRRCSPIPSPRTPTPSRTETTGGQTARSKRPNRSDTDLVHLSGQMDPSTDHFMQMQHESRHQIQSQSQGSRLERPLSPSTTTDPAIRPDFLDGPSKKVITSSGNNSSVPSVLPSKFNLTSVGVVKAAAVESHNDISQYGSSTKWKPFGQLGKGNFVKLAETGIVPERTEISQKNPSRNPTYSSQQSQTMGSRHSRPIHTRNNSHPSVGETPPHGDPQMSAVPCDKCPPSKATDICNDPGVPSSGPPIKDNGNVFKDYTYTNYLLSKYGGQGERSGPVVPHPSSVSHPNHQFDLAPFINPSSGGRLPQSGTNNSRSGYMSEGHEADRSRCPPSRTQSKSASTSRSSARQDVHERSISRSPSRAQTSVSPKTLPRSNLEKESVPSRSRSRHPEIKEKEWSSPPRFEDIPKLASHLDGHKPWQSSSRGDDYTTNSAEGHSSLERAQQNQRPTQPQTRTKSHLDSPNWIPHKHRASTSDKWAEPRRHVDTSTSKRVSDDRRTPCRARMAGRESRSPSPHFTSSRPAASSGDRLRSAPSGGECGGRGRSAANPADRLRTAPSGGDRDGRDRSAASSADRLRTAPSGGDRDGRGRSTRQDPCHRDALSSGSYSSGMGLSSGLSQDYSAQPNYATASLTQNSLITSADQPCAQTLLASSAVYTTDQSSRFSALAPTGGNHGNYDRRSGLGQPFVTSRDAAPCMAVISDQYSYAQGTGERCTDPTATNSVKSSLDRYPYFTSNSTGSATSKPPLASQLLSEHYPRKPVIGGFETTATSHVSRASVPNGTSLERCHTTPISGSYSSKLVSESSLRLGKTLRNLERKFQIQNLVKKYASVQS